jgi:ABC-type sugar transport system substrate-binding protein
MSAEVTFNSYKIGQLDGDAAIANSNGTVDAVIFHEADYLPVSDSIEAGIESEFKRLCPTTCTWKLEDITVPDWATKLPLLTRTAILNTSVNTIIPLFDGETPYVIPAINQGGARNRVKVVSFNATPAALQFLVNKDALVADLGDPLEMEGFQFADQDFRALLGKPPASETLESPPIEMFTPSNFTAAMIKQPELSWYGKLNFAALYEKLWGLG